MALEDAAVDVPSSEPSAADRLVAAELSERVGEALERLPSGQRIVLALSVYEGADRRGDRRGGGLEGVSSESESLARAAPNEGIAARSRRTTGRAGGRDMTYESERFDTSSDERLDDLLRDSATRPSIVASDRMAAAVLQRLTRRRRRRRVIVAVAGSAAACDGRCRGVVVQRIFW